MRSTGLWSRWAPVLVLLALCTALLPVTELEAAQADQEVSALVASISVSMAVTPTNTLTRAVLNTEVQAPPESVGPVNRTRIVQDLVRLPDRPVALTSAGYDVLKMPNPRST